ncbi:MAG: methyl-accepting chemotaxis protein [Treponema sp.]|nr:methyl-accepting chemotaxis protein [Treponema sp.]
MAENLNAELSDRKERRDSKLRRIVSAIAFLIALVLCVLYVKTFARRTFEKTARKELAQIEQNMQLRFSVGFNEQLALALQMAASPLIVHYFENPDDKDVRNAAFEEVAAYQNSFLSNLSFMINDKDKKYYSNGTELYVLDPSAPSSGWYVNIMNSSHAYEFNISYDIGVKQTFMWLNCMVRNLQTGKALGLIGTGIPLTTFVETMFSNLPKDCTMYLYDGELKISGSSDIKLLEEKTPLVDLVPAFAGHEDELKGKDFRFVSRGKSIYALAPVGDIGWDMILFKDYTFGAFLSGAAVPFAVCVVLMVFLTAGYIVFFRIRDMHATEQTAGKRLLEEIQRLVTSAKENEATSQDQSAAVKEIVATMEDNTALGESMSKKAKDVSALADKTNTDVSDGVAYLEQNVRQLREISSANQHTIDGIKHLSDKIDSIWDIVTLINSVADQAKIIAFNAELEASSAGESGKNFHIVATEIRRLADGIIDGTREIKERITEIQTSSDSLILLSESGTEKINEGCAGAQQLEKQFESIRSASEVTASSASDITTIIQQQAMASEQILITLKQIAAGVEGFAQATEYIASSSETLRSIAHDLHK